MNYEFEKYVATVETLKSVLDTYGVAIIPNVLNAQECADMEAGMWSTLNTWSQSWEVPISRDNPDSWRSIRDLFPRHSMLIQHWGIGHAPFIWDLRQNPKCIAPFAKLWNCAPEDLLVSYDGASFHMPPETTNIGKRRTTWFHSDQSYLRPDFECVQSWVTAMDVNDGDATLAFFEKSHLFHEEIRNKFNIVDKSDWYKVSEEQIKYYIDAGCEERYIRCPKGSMVFWDSRAIHCGVESTRRDHKNFRCVAYMCYTPRIYASRAQLKKKQVAFETLRTTSHWPHKVKLFPKLPRTYGASIRPIKELPIPHISELGKKLAGY